MSWVDGWRWRRKVAAWGGARFPELWSWRGRVRSYVLLAELLVWKYAWLEPLRSLHYAGVLTYEQFEDAAFSPLRRPRS